MKRDIEIQDLALEVIDMLGVALYFAGAKENKLEELINLYMQELDKSDENLPYDQQHIICLIQSLQKKYPQFFNQDN